MRWFANLKTAYKLGLGFGLCLTLQIAVAGFGIFAIHRASHTTTHITSHQIPALSACLELPEAVRTIRRDLRDGLLLQEEADVAKWTASYATADAKVANQVDAYASLASTTEERSQADALKSAAAAWLPIRNKVRELAQGKQFDEARKLLYGPEYKATRLAVETAAKDALDYQRTAADRAAAGAAAQGNQALAAIGSLSGVAVLLGILAAGLITLRITRPLARVSERMETIQSVCLTNLA